MPFKTVLYVSRAQRHRAQYQLKTLVPLARVANDGAAVTSILQYDGANYMQLLEGPTKTIDQVMARIAMDSRHKDVRVLADERRSERSYIGLPLTYVYDESRQSRVTQLVDGHSVSSREVSSLLF
ncbi:MAG: BLUF domain-containing protein [Comamonadaceae bacterium]|nr:MAG: BLUF domain-containing protein [Comamonadaceae bacterium]